MKFRCGETRADMRERRFKAKLDWHHKFAWWPVRVGPNDCRWLEYVDRKGTPFYHRDGYDWEYVYRPATSYFF